jgi:hypothetical protein
MFFRSFGLPRRRFFLIVLFPDFRQYFRRDLAAGAHVASSFAG